MGARSSTLSLIVALGGTISGALGPLRPTRRIASQTAAPQSPPPQAKRDTNAGAPKADTTSVRTGVALSVVAIATILFQMNRNSTSSRIGHTTAGEITGDTRFILTLLLVTGVPLITIISAELPGVREFLFAWVTPALKAVAKT
jgi:hypothetical protein